MPHITKVTGPPGTGKTTRLIQVVRDEIAVGVNPWEIVYTSFTKAAALEARQRAIVAFPQFVNDDFPYFSTIHSICFRLLELDREHVFSGKRVKEFCDTFHYDISVDGQPDEDSDTDLPGMMLNTDADYFELFLGWMRNLMLDFDTAYKLFSAQPGIPEGFNADMVKLYIKRRNEYKVDKGLFDFTDFIQTCLSENLYPRDVKVIIADEVQDESLLLSRLLDMWSEHAERLYLGADPYQAIFGFCGADPSIFINHKADEDILLKQSYRCPVAIHDLARKIVKRFKLRYHDDDFIPAPGDKGFVFRNVAEGLDWSKMEGTTFYLHRTHWLLSSAYNDLIREGIPFITTNGKQSPIQSVRAKTVATLYRLVNWKEVSIKEISKLMDYLPTKTDKYMFLAVGAKTDCRKLVKAKPDKMVTLRTLPELGFTTDFLAFLNKSNILEPLKLSDSEKSYFRMVIAKYGVDALDSQPNTLLSTIHGVKGREADNVILNLQLTRRTNEAFIDSPDPEHRLMYVGVTRAKRTVTLLDGNDDKVYDL